MSWVALNLVHWFYTTTGMLSTHVVAGLFIQLLVGLLVGSVVYYAYSKVTTPEEITWLRRNAFSKG